jgi:putative oxidoreductase
VRDKTNVLLWVLQTLLAVFFALASGLPKLILPADQLPMPIPLAQSFVWFIGVCEVLGALGLVLPGILRIRPGITALAAACLAALTICAAVYQLVGGRPGSAAFAIAVGAFCAVVAHSRRRSAPRGAARPAGVLGAV